MPLDKTVRDAVDFLYAPIVSNSRTNGGRAIAPGGGATARPAMVGAEESGSVYRPRATVADPTL